MNGPADPQTVLRDPAAAKLVTSRRRRRWSMQRMAQRLAISKTTLFRIERRLQDPSFEAAVVIERLGPGAPRVEEWPSLREPVRELLALRAAGGAETNREVA